MAYFLDNYIVPKGQAETRLHCRLSLGYLGSIVVLRYSVLRVQIVALVSSKYGRVIIIFLNRRGNENGLALPRFD